MGKLSGDSTLLLSSNTVLANTGKRSLPGAGGFGRGKAVTWRVVALMKERLVEGHGLERLTGRNKTQQSCHYTCYVSSSVTAQRALVHFRLVSSILEKKGPPLASTKKGFN